VSVRLQDELCELLGEAAEKELRALLAKLLEVG
jgi:hypothetical protein